MFDVNWKKILINLLKVIIAIIAANFLLYGFLIIAMIAAFSNVNADIYTILFFIIGILIELTLIGALWEFISTRVKSVIITSRKKNGCLTAKQ